MIVVQRDQQDSLSNSKMSSKERQKACKTVLQKKKRKDEEMMQEGKTNRERRTAMEDAVLPDTNEMNTKTRTNSCNRKEESLKIISSD